jgi:hypothetical protein
LGVRQLLQLASEQTGLQAICEEASEYPLAQEAQRVAPPQVLQKAILQEAVVHV